MTVFGEGGRSRTCLGAGARVGGGAPHPLTRFTDTVVTYFAWSPDGKRLAITRGTNLADIDRIARDVEIIARDVPGVSSAFAERLTGGRYIDVDIDRAAAVRRRGAVQRIDAGPRQIDIAGRPRQAHDVDDVVRGQADIVGGRRLVEPSDDNSGFTQYE